MANMTTVEVKAFVPAKDFDLSKQFYRDLGFDLAWADDHLAEFRHGSSSFLLQNFYNEVHAGNFMMHLLVEDVDAWWRHVEDQGLSAKYSVVHAEPPADRGVCEILFSSIRLAFCGESGKPRTGSKGCAINRQSLIDHHPLRTGMVGPDRVEISRHTDKVDASATLPNERVALS